MKTTNMPNLPSNPEGWKVVFIERAMASREAAKQDNRYIPADQVLKKLSARLDRLHRET